jgi:hypothetical protein
MPKLDAEIGCLWLRPAKEFTHPKARPKSLQCISKVQMLLPQAPGLGIFHCVINDLEK